GAECGVHRALWPAADSRRDVVVVGVVERHRTAAHHRRFSEAPQRLVRARLAQPAHLAMGAAAVGLRLHSAWCDFGLVDLDAVLVFVASQSADRSCRNLSELSARSVAGGCRTVERSRSLFEASRPTT